MRKKYFFMSLALMIMLLLVANGRPVPGKEITKKIKLGSAQPLSGPASLWGISSDRLIKKGCEDVNKAGGIPVGNVRYKWEVITYDTAYIPSQALDVTTKLIVRDKVDFVSVFGGGVQTILLDLLNKHKMVNVGIATSYDFFLGPKWPFNFSVVTPGLACVWSATEALGKLGLKTAVYVGPDDEHGRGYTEGRIKQMEAVGIKCLGKNFYPRGEREFYPMLRPLLAKKPDYLDPGTGGARDEGLIIKQARELGFKGPVCIGYVSARALETIAETKNMEDVYLFAPAIVGVKGEGKPEEIKNWYVSKYGAEEFDNVALAGYALVELLTQAIKNAQSLDSVKVAKALEGIDKDHPLETALGKAYFGLSELFGNNHSLLNNFNVYLFKNGKWRQVGGGMASIEWMKK